MAMEPEFLELMTQTITRKPSASMDGYGGRTYGAPLQHPCHIDGQTVEVTGPDGNVVTADGQLWAPHIPDASTSDIITLPGETRARKLITVKTVYDEAGPHHTKLYYGSMV